MGVACAIAMMAIIFVVVLLVSRWDAKTAYRMLNHSQHLFEPESKDVSIMPLGASYKAKTIQPVGIGTGGSAAVVPVRPLY